MEQLIPVINRLQDAFALVEGGAASIGLDLPQIVVVGSQSSGKSSVLENVVGKDFLPRGSGIVTRRPLVLQLINTPKTGLNDSEWGEFLHLPGEKFTDFSQIREEIQKETDRLTGKNKGISPYPISLKVYSPNVLNLTLVDLPGITRVPIGDQPKDIESQIRRMILNYIEKPNSIILAVTAGNSDLTTSDALELAKSVDPEGKRTLGVITKLDLMDKGTDALDMLLGKIVPLKLGFIGVVNRSQKDINDRKTIVDAKKDEKEYFSNHPVYKGIASRLGTPFLASQLNKILMNHIKNTLPDIKQKINQMILETNDQLMALGDTRYDISPGAMLLQIINAFALSYTETIEGKLTEDVSVDELYGGARINYIFNEIFSKYLLTLQPLDGLSPFDIRTAVSNATGPKSALFVPEQAFELLVRRQLGRIKEPAIQCVDLVFDELERIVNGINSSELQRFRNLKEELSEAGTNLLRNCRAPTKEMINNVMSMEINFINTNHPDFQVDAIIGGVMKRRQDRMNPPQPEPDMRMQQQQLPPQLPVKQPQQSSNPVPMKSSNAPIKQDQMKGGYPSNSPPDQTNAGFFGMFFGKGGKGEMEISNPTNNPQQAMLNQQQYLQQQQQQLRNQQQQQQQMQRQQQQKQQQQNYFSGSNGMNGSDGRPLKLGQVPSVLSVSTIPQEKQFEIELLEGLLEAYFNIVRKNIQDYVPKAIMYFMVAKSKSDMQNELIQKLYKESQFEHLLQEGSDIVSKRMTCKKNLDLLNKAQVILSEVREYNLSSNTKI